MVLMPKRVKFRKTHRGRRKGLSNGGSRVSFGEFGLQAIEAAWVKNTQLEASRVALTRSVRRGGKIWICIFPDKPVTKKPAETRMGKGKGMPEYWVTVVKPGRIIFEIEGIPIDVAKAAMRLAALKLPMKTKFVSRLQI